ncbi:DASH family cryptochrome [Thermaurantimonas aggregans]|uniref:DASH family cryptochrome n=1 Tax=Thermaurantimonas aggregans TaxID=2173829 RepID=UPI0023F1A9C8|nr:DASH family cryptochrome [Thermaurantimonas aggregans]MCX8148991.1 DASH family cryptochrome [Thermaurantimonas aggregans]
MKEIALVWYRFNLRTIDCAPLDAAVRSGLPVVPFYCFDTRYHSTLHTDWPRMGQFRAKFLMESVQDLRNTLRALGSDLYVVKGFTETEIQKLQKNSKIIAIYYPKYYTEDEVEIEQKVADLGIKMIGFDDHSLIAPKDLPFSIENSPKVFTDFRKKVEKNLKIKPEYPKPSSINTPDEYIEKTELPTLSDLGISQNLLFDSRSAVPFVGGEHEAWQRLIHYFWNTKKLSVYKETRNGLIGTDYSSKFSVNLAHGCISARSIFWQIKKYEESVETNESTYWLFFELLWRDFFFFTAMKLKGNFFKVPRNYTPKKTKIFEKWRQGETHEPFVNANMKELLYTGFMSNRGRQNVASYLVHNLKQDWYLGAMWFESQLIDYDVCSNYGNWTYVAGIGNDPRNRVFNVKRQAEMYDPDGSYQNLWLG